MIELFLMLKNIQTTRWYTSTPISKYLHQRNILYYFSSYLRYDVLGGKARFYMDNIITENLKQVQNNINYACERAGRSTSQVTPVAVSKTKTVEMIMEAYNAGIRDFGENYVQELVDKIDIMPKDIRWHMIGHLQRNKVKYIVGKVAMIHSVDSLRLAEEISKESVKKNVVSEILIEVNVGMEESKFGITTDNALDMVIAISQLPNIVIRGFMTSAPFVDNAEDNRKIFKGLHNIIVDIRDKNIDNTTMDVLSMGMTNDYIVAVEEGASMVRVGTAIFGARNYNI